MNDPTPAPPTRKRPAILALVTAGTLINYLDRTVISVAAPLMSKELALDAAVMGIVFSAFSWTYAAAQFRAASCSIASGSGSPISVGDDLVDLHAAARLCHRTDFFWSPFVWARRGRGARLPYEQSNSPVLGSRQAERARATGVYSIGQYFGLAFLSPLLFWIAGTFGWRALLIIVGAIGIGFGFVWYAIYRDPQQSTANDAELDYIGSRWWSCARERRNDALRMAAHRIFVAPATDIGRFDRTVLRQLDASVLLNVVPDLSRHRTSYGLD
jgi:ACS family D-galactonate transporter-like MFS transporter